MPDATVALSKDIFTGVVGQAVVKEVKATPASGVPTQGFAAMILIK